MYLDLKTLPAELLENLGSFKYALYQNGVTTPRASGSFYNNPGVTCATNNTNHIVLLENETTSVTQVTYTLYIWIDGTLGQNPDTMMNKSFEFVLHADGDKLRTGTCS